MINQINFTNYKSFKEKQELMIKPITVLIGKNSSGKSAIAKLPTLIEGALSGKFGDPLLTINEGVELGAEFRDLIYGRESVGSIEFELFDDENNVLVVEVTSGAKDFEFPRIRRWKLNEEIELKYDDVIRRYRDEISEEIYSCEFYGFNLSVMLTSEGSRDSPVLNMKLNTNYIGPFRHSPARTHNISGARQISKLGNQGEKVYETLIIDQLYYGGDLVKKTSEWYQNNFEGWGIGINSTSKPDYKVELIRSKPTFSINIRDVGEGMSQALPLVVSAYMVEKLETLTIIEQPELHLHPAAHGNLAELFATSSLQNTMNHFLIETHSQNFVLRLRRLIAEKKLSKDNVIIYYVDYDGDSNTSCLKRIDINDSGDVTYWPEDVFNESLDETIAIRAAQRKLQNNGN